MIGRHPESDVVVDPDLHDVSRAHAIIDWQSGPAVTVTDLSTRGTYVPMPDRHDDQMYEVVLP